MPVRDELLNDVFLAGKVRAHAFRPRRRERLGVDLLDARYVGLAIRSSPVRHDQVALDVPAERSELTRQPRARFAVEDFDLAVLEAGTSQELVCLAHQVLSGRRVEL